MIKMEKDVICPFSLSSGNILYCNEGRVGNQHNNILGKGVCKAWKPAVKREVREAQVLIGYHIAPGWCMLIPNSEPDVKFISRE